MEISVSQAFLQEPRSRAEVPAWFETVSHRNLKGQCWRCGLTIQELDNLEHDVSHWSAHFIVKGHIIGSQSCNTESADRFDAVLDEYFETIAALAKVP